MDKNLTNKNKNNSSLLNEKSRLKIYRELKQLTQEQLAEMIDVSNNYISMLENGKRNINDKIAEKLGNILQVSADYLTYKTDNPYPFKFNTSYIASDYAFISFLSFKYDIILCIEDINPLSNQEKQLRIDQIYNIDFSKVTCVYAINKHALKERLVNGIIKRVIINGKSYAYGQFLYIINEIQREIYYKIDNMENIFDSYNRNVVQNEILTTDMLENKELYNNSFQEI